MADTGQQSVEVHGGELHVTRFGSGSRAVLGIHGITASSMSLAVVARHLGDDITLLAPDLRGRGASAGLPGPYGMRAHAEDCAATIRALCEPPVVVLGHSMGGYVAVVLAATHPELVERLVLADGGLPLPLPDDAPDDIDPDEVIDVVLGPAIDRLTMVFPTEESYLDFWRAHPAMEEWSSDVEAYLRYDLRPTEGGYRSRVVEPAVRTDGAEQMVAPDLIPQSLRAVGCPIRFIGAPRGLLNQPSSLIPDEVVRHWQDELPDLRANVVDDVNHYTLVIGERGAAEVARAVRDG
ncbi:MAG TPA: alpha/beta hydrolase [Acidimicrobiales bacterium]|jgi:pimeloyl-ACP methyl ester carboxylesterase